MKILNNVILVLIITSCCCFISPLEKKISTSEYSNVYKQIFEITSNPDLLKSYNKRYDCYIGQYGYFPSPWEIRFFQKLHENLSNIEVVDEYISYSETVEENVSYPEFRLTNEKVLSIIIKLCNETDGAKLVFRKDGAKWCLDYIVSYPSRM